MIRVLHVVDSLATGGLEMGLVKIIRGLDRSRFEHSVCAVRGLGALAAQVHDLASLDCLEKTAPGYSFLVAELAREIRKTQPHVVHSRNWGTIEAVLAGRLAGGRRCRLVHSEHGFETAAPIEPKSKLWFRRAAYEMADRVLSVSYQLRDIHAARTGFPARRIGVIHNGVDIDRFRPDASARVAARAQLGLAEDEFCVGAVGRLQPVKDHATLLRAAAALPGCRVVIAGDGSERERLRQMAGPGAMLLGEVHDVAALLNAFDAYVLPSLTEGISNSLLEAMATGLPALATNAGGNPEVIEDGRSGKLFPAGDAAMLATQLYALSRQPELRKSLGDAALRRVRQHFSIDAMLSGYGQLYDGLGR